MKLSVFVVAFAVLGAVAFADMAPIEETIKLTTPPRQRWVPLMSRMASDPFARVLLRVILVELATVYNKLGCDTNCRAELSSIFQSRFPEQFEECAGIAAVLQNHSMATSTEDIAAMQFMSEIMHLETHSNLEWGCTGSVVCSADRTHVIHGRNLDWSSLTLVKVLWNLISWEDADGKIAFRTSAILGDIGTETGMSRAFSVNTNWKAGGNTTLAEVMECIRDKESLAPFGVVLRTLLQDGTSFSDARDFIKKGRVCAPVMTIMAGTGVSEGSIIIKQDSAAVMRTVDCAKRSPWHVTISVKDWDVEPQDPRAVQVEKHLESLGPDVGGTHDAILKVFSTAPTLSNGTILTAIMTPSAGDLFLTIRD